MAASTRTKSKTPQDKRSTAKTWKRAGGEDIKLPSGNVALVKRPGPAALMSQGVLPDDLTPIVNDALSKGKKVSKAQTAEIMKDPKAIAGLMDSIDRISAVVIMEPPVKYHRRPILGDDGEPVLGDDGKEQWEDIPEAQRDPDEFIYTDEIDFDDKMMIFQYATGGTRDFHRFREELAASVGDLSSGEEGGDQPE